MSCLEVLAMIDALPFAESRPHQLAAVERHARGCASCRDALTAARALTAELVHLPEPEPPADMTTAILERAARLDDRSVDEAWEAPRTVPLGGVRGGDTAPAEARGDRPAWAALMAGGASVLGALAYPYLVGESSISFVSLLLGGGFFEMPSANPVTLVLAAGLTLYAAGLFAVSAGRRRGTSI